MTCSIKTLTLALASAALFGIPALSQAADTVTRQRAVHYSDLDLRTLPGNVELYRRLAKASATVCRGDEIRVLSKEEDQCRTTAIDNAVASVNSPMLSLINGGYEPVAIVLAPQPIVTVRIVEVGTR
jgi:UrcA family protein